MDKRMRAEDDDIDSRDKPCTCKRVLSDEDSANRRPGAGREDIANCAKHGISASLARENRYWQRVGRD
jgi:hypothetical protein